MDYIQQAIDKAREERQGNIGKPRDEKAVSSSSQAQPSKIKTSLPEVINYTSTKQITLDSDILKKNRIVAAFDDDPSAEVYRQLRTQVIQKARANGWKTLAVTSPNENAGKTVTAINLAIALSKEVNQTVMLADLDLRTPSVAEALGIKVEKGVVDHLHGDATMADLLINPGFERLVILPGKADPNYSSEILSSPLMSALLEDLTSRYESRIIIFDLPALLDNDDAMTFTPVVDATLLVVEDGVSSPEDIKKSLELLEGTNLLGTILNKAD
jgi:protein-tyrosine kinase